MPWRPRRRFGQNAVHRCMSTPVTSVRVGTRPTWRGRRIEQSTPRTHRPSRRRCEPYLQARNLPCADDRALKAAGVECMRVVRAKSMRRLSRFLDRLELLSASRDLTCPYPTAAPHPGVRRPQLVTPTFTEFGQRRRRICVAQKSQFNDPQSELYDLFSRCLIVNCCNLRPSPTARDRGCCCTVSPVHPWSRA
jgi:hypothetical protein